jgi:FHS family glucose/mannose:H+ symporter-like MFS transporter
MPAMRSPTRRPPATSSVALRAGIAGGVAFGLLGWRGLLVPSLVRSIEPAFGRTDADVGSYFFLTAISYAAGSLIGARLIRSLGERRVLSGAALLMALGLVIQSATTSWLVFAAAGISASLGAATSDMGLNALVLDLFPHARGRALNLLHVMYSAAALSAPLVLAFAVEAGMAWQTAFAGTAVAAVAIALLLLVYVPADPAAVGGVAASASVARRGSPISAGASLAPGSRRLPPFLLLLALALACYVGAESGTSDWLVRYLAALPLAVAGSALTLFWGGIAFGRVVFARIGNRFEPLRTASVLAYAGANLVALAVLMPLSPVTPLLFGLAGTAFGPIFPLVVAGAGARMPGKSSTVSATMTFAGVLGAIAYPPAMGLMSVTIGLPIAMIGTAVLLVGCGTAILVSGRLRV